MRIKLTSTGVQVKVPMHFEEVGPLPITCHRNDRERAVGGTEQDRET
jgi:hypothetical protein